MQLPRSPLDILEQIENNVLVLFTEALMFQTVHEKAATLASLALCLGMVAVWVHIFAVL